MRNVNKWEEMFHTGKYEDWKNNVAYCRERELCFFCHGPRITVEKTPEAIEYRNNNGACAECDWEVCMSFNPEEV